ncbi:LysR family transcriptional regulator [Paenibacillus sp. LjRoot153]|uniref:LysR substrate-binding domain-containing protein n=1 Tax=Paenibacillus sp. LjRoot153 TaxID=3342270 RepID=UPI003ED148FB
MNIENIEAFVYIHHLGSFNKAAQALFLTQPSVSARIQTLERELGSQLFYREGKHILITENGKQFLPYAQQIMTAYQEIKIKLQQNLAISYEFKIGCAISVSNYLVPDILPLFSEKFPGVKIKITTGHSNIILEKVLNKEVDLGIVRTVTHPNIDNILFHKDPIGLFVPPGHPLLKKGSAAIDEISRFPLIFFDYGSMDWLMITRLFENMKPNIVMEVDSMETAKKLIQKGMGISFLPEHCVRNEFENGLLYRVEITPEVDISIRIDLIYLKGSSNPFLNFFQQISFGKT